MSQEVQRKIKFYRQSLGNKANGEPISINYQEIVEHLDALDGNQRILDIGDGITVLCKVHQKTSPYKIRFIKVKTKDLPKIMDEAYNESDLEEGKGISESSHVVLFENNVVGLEYNRNGPSFFWINDYIKTKAEDFCKDLSYGQLIWPSKLEQLNKLDNLLRVELKVKQSFDVERGEVFNDGDNLKIALEALQNMNNVGELSLTLTSDDSRKREGWDGLGANLRKTVKDLLTQHSKTSGLKTLKVKGVNSENQNREEINILESLLIVNKKFIKLDGSRSVSSNDAFDKIVQAHTEKKGQIIKAVELLSNDELVLES